MKDKRSAVKSEIVPEEQIRREVERTNARMRHFRGVAASVMTDALKLWEEIWETCQDPRTCEEIIEGKIEPAGKAPACGWPEFMEKLNLLRHYIDYAKRLCEGSIDNPPKDESEE